METHIKPLAQIRSSRIDIRLTPDEKKHLVHLGLEAGLSASDFVRVTVLGSKPFVQKATIDRAILIRFLAETGKIGSNINQIAKALNSQLLKGRMDGLPVGIVENSLIAIQTLSHHLINHLEHGVTR